MLWGAMTFQLIGLSQVKTMHMISIALAYGAVSVLLAVFVRYKKYILRMSGPLRYGALFIIFQIYFFFYLALYMFIVSLAFVLVTQEWVATVSLQYLQLDTVWRMYDLLDPVVLFFTKYEGLLQIVNLFYAQTIIVMFVTLFVLPFCSARLTRQYILAFFFSSLLATILWVSGPAVAPYQLATSDKFDESQYKATISVASEPVLQLYEKHVDTSWAHLTDSYTQYWRDITSEYGYAVSSNPSMHIVWGILLIVYLWRAYVPLGFVAALYAMIESIGTMLFLQHYFIDILAGVLFAFVSIWIAGKLERAEAANKHFDQVFWFTPLLLAEQAGARAREWLKDKLSAH